ncbi:DUF5719 family protein [Lacisediminihabitans profunda]|uniref:Large extracellular alpha-helical protein n=1 Tax=Lacisediminihabitans profunda TaxID=2594790 RepID=A0A5C8UND7_9MICO|nr:DUF5719 family protein [Lacisediminihabitans profunda]TXN28797.1 hypothetical protein FVP33_16540 [Lacisediminihabitans profunda]
MTDDLEPEPELEVAPEPLPEPLPSSKTPGRARGAVLVGARIVAGTVGVGVAALALAAAALLPIPRHTVSPPSVLVTPVATAQERVCAGPLLRLGDETGAGAATASSVGRPTVRFAQSAGRAQSAPLSATENTTGVAPQLLTLPAGSSAARPLLAGAQSQAVSSEDLVGFAAAECTEATSDSWLVGGATDTGRTTLLTLSNPSAVPATVTLTIYSETGVVSAAGTDGIVVPASSQRVFSLAGFAPNTVSPVVRVQSRGGQVVANLQQSTVRTLEPGGVDIVGAASGPSSTSVIPGMVVANSDAVVGRQGEPGFADLGSVIRLFVPGDKAAKARVSVVPENGTAEIKSVAVDVPAGVVTDVPLDTLADGSYTISVSSDIPLVAGARVSTVGSTGQSDFAWLAAAEPLDRKALVEVAPGPSPLLHLANSARASATVKIATKGQPDATVTIPAGQTVTYPVVASSAYTISGFSTLSLAVSYTGDAQLSAYSVSSSAPASLPIRIFP